MTAARDGAAARRYHERTKHSFRSVRAQPHHLDWDNRPHPFKEYLGVQGIPLPGDLPRPEVAALDAIAATPRGTSSALARGDLAHAVGGLDPGVYRFAAPSRFELVQRGRLRRQAGYVCLEQALGARAAATIFLLTDLDATLAALGDRGYRAAQLEAGVRAGRISLAANAQRLGATGLTFYDDDVSDLVAPGTSLTPMMCVAVGVDARRPGLRRPRARLSSRA
jgi:hypothetical protein